MNVVAALLLAIVVLFLLTVIAGLLAVLGLGVRWAIWAWKEGLPTSTFSPCGRGDAGKERGDQDAPASGVAEEWA